MMTTGTSPPTSPPPDQERGGGGAHTMLSVNDSSESSDEDEYEATDGVRFEPDEEDSADEFERVRSLVESAFLPAHSQAQVASVWCRVS